MLLNGKKKQTKSQMNFSQKKVQSNVKLIKSFQLNGDFLMKYINSLELLSFQYLNAQYKFYSILGIKHKSLLYLANLVRRYLKVLQEAVKTKKAQKA
jgi:hypothetical protein